jgi:hypothetical protein
MRIFGRKVGGGRRAASREAMPLPAIVSTIESRFESRLSDLSATGARLSGRSLPEVGQPVILRIDRVKAFGTVAWAAKTECGIEFEEPLAAFDMATLRREMKLAMLTWRNIDEKLAIEDWANGLAR